MNDMHSFKENAAERGICPDFKDKWDKCQSKKQAFDIGMHVQGVPYICRSIVEKWGLSPEYIATRFSAFINGRYVSQQAGYDSETYCMYDGGITARTTLLLCINHKGVITVPENHVCKIYAVDSVTRIEGEGICHVYQYGSCSVSSAPSIKCIFEESE